VFGGAYAAGTVFEITPYGKLTTIYSFGIQAANAYQPYGGLVQGANGHFYGTTRIGGTYGQGTVFEVTQSGKWTILHNFCREGHPCPDGQ
jgi:uncharacterized repeat protein (TIGR03803 family)